MGAIPHPQFKAPRRSLIHQLVSYGCLRVLCGREKLSGKASIDNGPKLVSLAMADWAEEHGGVLDFNQPGKPTQNSFIERFIRAFREEVLDLYIFSRLSEVREIIDRRLMEYNKERAHESLGNLTTAD